MKSNTNYPLLGQILKDRYQILRVLSAGAFGQTYAARDLQDPRQPEYAVKHYALDLDYPSLAIASRRFFRTEVESLKKLGTHGQIPQLICSFETECDLYLIQELIVGPTLSDYLLTLKTCEGVERETAAIALLRDGLNVLNFIHAQGTLHCDLKPNNLMRRDRDGAWVVIDFGTAQPLNSCGNDTSPHLSLKSQAIAPLSGYLAPEQSLGKCYPNSDIYALGIIVLETLTGLNPLNPKDFQRHPQTGELTWFSNNATETFEFGEALLATIQKMVQYNVQKRCQSAAEVLQALNPTTPPEEAPPILENATAVREEEDLSNALAIVKPQTSEPFLASSRPRPRRFRCSRLSPLLGVWVVTATLNTFAIASSWQTLSDPAGVDAGTSLLFQASRIYHQGNLESAIALMQSVSPESPAYPESRSAIQQWQQDWQQAEAQFQEIEQHCNRQEWGAALGKAQVMPGNRFWQQRLKPLIHQAQINGDAEAQRFFHQALDRAERKDFTQALYYLEKIPFHTQLGARVRPKLFEYRYKQRIRATAMLQQAYNLAAQRNFSDALYYLEKIPPRTPAGAIARKKKVEYARKQRIKAQVEVASPSGDQTHLNPGDRLQEI